MLACFNRIGRVFFVELAFLVPALLVATEKLSQSGWDGIAQMSLFHGALLAVLVLTGVAVIVGRNRLDDLCDRSARMELLIDGDGFLGVCVFPALAVLLVGEFIVYPWHMELLVQAFRNVFCS